MVPTVSHNAFFSFFQMTQDLIDLPGHIDWKLDKKLHCVTASYDFVARKSKNLNVKKITALLIMVSILF